MEKLAIHNNYKTPSLHDKITLILVRRLLIIILFGSGFVAVSAVVSIEVVAAAAVSPIVVFEE
jgi:hypothetical protein